MHAATHCGLLPSRYFLRDEIACLGLHAPSVAGIYCAAAPELPPSCPVVGATALLRSTCPGAAHRLMHKCAKAAHAQI